MLTSLAALFDVERSVFESEAVELALKLFWRLDERDEREEPGREPDPPWYGIFAFNGEK